MLQMSLTGLADDLFARQEERGAGVGAGEGEAAEAGFSEVFGEAEVGDFGEDRVGRGGEEDVLRLQGAMDDAARSRRRGSRGSGGRWGRPAPPTACRPSGCARCSPTSSAAPRAARPRVLRREATEWLGGKSAFEETFPALDRKRRVLAAWRRFRAGCWRGRRGAFRGRRCGLLAWSFSSSSSSSGMMSCGVA